MLDIPTPKQGSIADVFISYASEDRKRAQMLAEALEARGLSVWWDRNIVAGQAFDAAIEHELETARSVVVLWSKHSVPSEWVKNEAAMAVERGVLVPAFIDAIKPPLEFRRKQTADLIGWDGDMGNVGFDALCRGVAALVARDLPPQDVPPVHEPGLAAATPPPTIDAKNKSMRRVFLWSGIALLILAMFSLWYWDAYYRPESDYYANVIRRWGLPEGVGRLTDKQVKHRNVALAFIQHGRWGPVKEVRVVNSRGAYPPQLVSLAPLSLALLNPFVKSEEYQGVVRVTFERDANGQIFKQSVYNRADRLLYALHYVQPDVAEYKLGAFSMVVRESGITHIKIVRPETGPEAGLEKELLWLDSTGAPKPDHDGSFGSRITFNELGLPVEWINLGADGQPAPDRVGIAKLAAKYDDQGNMTQLVNLGPNGERVLNPITGAETKIRHDQYGNITELAFFGTDGQLITSKKAGVAGRTLAYDERGNYVEGTSFGPDRQLVRGPLGFARETVVWDEKGGSLSSVFGPDGKPMALFGRVIKSKTVWDQRGFPSEEVYFDENERPIRDKVGCVKNKLTHDKHGNMTEVSCFDEGDQLVRNTLGFARAKMIYDERGNRLEMTSFGLSGQPEHYEEPYVKVRAKHDSQGKLAERAYFDAADNLVKNRDRYAKATYTYDLYGNLVEGLFFDEKGKPAQLKNGYSKIVRAYDERGNMTEEAFFDVEGKPVRNEDGSAKIRYAHDNRGYRIETAYYDERDRPMLSKDGCAKLGVKYNDRGREIERTCFGFEGAILVSEGGCAKARTTYDARGELSRIGCFDPSDRPMRSAEGYFTIKYSYDDLGRETKREFFDVNGAPVFTRVTIEQVEAGSKSQRVGLQVEDLILGYDGQEVADTRVFDELELVRGERPRHLTIQRDGRVLSLEVSAGRLTGIATSNRVPAELKKSTEVQTKNSG